MKFCRIKIKGMHCRSCELLVEDELLKIPGVTKVLVDHRTGVAEIEYQQVLYQRALERAIARTGYSLGEEKKSYVSRNLTDYKELGIAFLIAMTLFLIARNLGLFNLSGNVSGNYSSLPAVFLIGLTAGVSTCMALVGGLVLGASARFSENHPEASRLEKFKPHLLFNLGRIGAYFLLGGVIGAIGSVFQLSTSVVGMLTIAVGLVMLLLGGQLIEIFPILKSISLTIPKELGRRMGIKTSTNPAVMGALTFFLPCGFTQAMQLYAMSTGSVAAGAATMGVFALGTAPGLLGVGGITAAIKGNFARIFFKTAGVVVILLAIFNLSNGLNLLGVVPVRAESAAVDPNVKMVNGAQEVRMTQSGFGYFPNSFTIRKGIPVRWIITSQSVNTCAASIVSAKLGIRQGLVLGENLIEFTPNETGTIPFSCSMGMYRGVFKVVDKNGQPVSAVIINDQTPAPAASCGSGSGGCGCGSGARKTAVNNVTAPIPEISGQTQVITATYSVRTDITPNQFTVKANQPVRFEVTARENGQGCMGSVTLPGLSNKIELFTAGQKTIFEFTPTTPGNYNITCGMGIPRGQIVVS